MTIENNIMLDFLRETGEDIRNKEVVFARRRRFAGIVDTDEYEEYYKIVLIDNTGNTETWLKNIKPVKGLWYRMY